MFETHNINPNVVLESTCKQGTLEATYDEIKAVFGDPGPSDCYKSDAEWRIRFADGTPATIYNYKNGKNYCGDEGLPVEQINEWSVGGNTKAAYDKVLIAIQLYRESQAAPEGKVEEALRSAQDVMETVRAKHGHAFAQTVEVAMLARKQVDLMGYLVGHLFQAGEIPQAVSRELLEISAVISSRIISKFATLAKVSTEPDKAEMRAEEIMDWASRIMDIEQIAGRELFKQLHKEGGSD